jgi:hypothetical protein
MTASQLHDTNLGVQFGILPTVADMQDFLRVCLTWRQVFKDMTEFMRILHTRHFQPTSMVDTLAPLTPGMVWAPSPIALVGDYIEIRLDTTYAVHHRTAQYKFCAPEFQGWISELKRLVDAFGVLDPAALWDIIPFSFVVDWFINIGGWLHKHRPRLFPADVKFTDYCESIRLTQRLSYYASYLTPPGPIGQIGVGSSPVLITRDLLGVETRDIFVRKRFTPRVPKTIPGPRVPDSFVNLRRLSIASSLVAQRIPR